MCNKNLWIVHDVARGCQCSVSKSLQLQVNSHTTMATGLLFEACDEMIAIFSLKSIQLKIELVGETSSLYRMKTQSWD